MAISDIQDPTELNNDILMVGSPPPYFSQQSRPRIKDFLCNILFGDPKVLGIIHIMASLATAALGIIATLNFKSMWDCTGMQIPSSYTVVSGITIWGSNIHVVTGIFSIMTYRGTNLVTCAIVMSVISSVTAASAVILLTLDLFWTTYVPCQGYSLEAVHGIQGALFVFYIMEFSVSVLGAMVLKQGAEISTNAPLDPLLFVNEPLAGTCLPISLPTQGIYTTMMPVAPPPEYTP